MASVSFPDVFVASHVLLHLLALAVGGSISLLSA